MRPLARFELRLLGGATLLDAVGQPVVGRAVHRHSLALLAYLAVARESGASREKLIGILWPEREAFAARHLLRSAIHNLRQTLGAPALEAIGDTMHLDAGRVLVDVHQLETAIATGELERAVGLYRGPFVDGLFLDDAEEFDGWVSSQRMRLERTYEAALESLGEQSSREGQSEKAASWWQTLARRRLGDARIVVRTMEALAAAGDRAGALSLADAHVRLIAAEYGTKPDAAVVMLVGHLRAGGEALPAADDLMASNELDATPPLVSPMPASTPPAPAANDSTGDTAHAESHFATETLGRAASIRGRNRLRIAMAAALVAIAVPAAWAFWSRTGRQLPTAADVLAVAPFTLVAGAPAELKDGLSELLTQTLDQVTELRVVPARLVAARATELGAAGAQPERLARELHASGVIAGSVSQTPAGLVVTATLVGADGATRAQVEARGPAADLGTLVDQLSVGLLRELWGRRAGMPAPRLAAITTSSPAALRAYLRGESFLREALWDSAASALAIAVDLDSTFALAQLRLAEPSGWRYGMGSEPAMRALEAAQRFSNRLPPRERALLAFRLLHERGDLTAIDSSEALARRYPDDPEMQYVHADALFHALGAVRGQSAEATAAAFDTASRLDSNSARVWAHPITLALKMGDSVRYDRAVAHLLKLTSGSHVQVAEHPDYALLRRVRWSEPAASYGVLASRLRTNPPHEWQLEDLLQAIERACLLADHPVPDLVDSAYAAVLAAYPNRSQHGLIVRRAWLAVSHGRLIAARPLIDRLWEIDPMEATRLTMIPVLAGYAPSSWLAGDAARIDRALEFRDPAAAYLVPYLHAQLALAAGDAPTGRALLRASAVLEAQHPRGVARAQRGVMEAANGWARLVEGDTAGAIVEMEAGLSLVGYDGDALNQVRPVQVVLLRTLARRSDRRADAIDRIRVDRLMGATWPWWSRELADALRLVGEPEEASREERQFAALWAGADSAVRALTARDRAPGTALTR